MRPCDAYNSGDAEMVIPDVPSGVAPGARAELLTADEMKALDLLTEFSILVRIKVIGDAETGHGDRREFVAHVHALQASIMSNAAARAYPDRFRTLGGII